MGASPHRIEDGSLIRGKGRYTTDVTPPGALTAYLLRSPVAHANVKLGDLSAARAAPGVHLVWTADDVSGLAAMPSLAQGPATNKPTVPTFPVLCKDIVRHVGDAVAFIVADDLNSAKSAAELIEVDYDSLPSIIDTAHALDADAPLVWPDLKTNLGFVYEAGDKAATDAAFKKAAKTATLTIVNNRVVCNYIEPRAIVVERDKSDGRYTVTVGSQGVHGLRDAMCKVLKADPKGFRVLTPDVGGGFGTKGFNYREYPLVVRAVEALGRPVKWVSDRNEHFLADAHGRDHVSTGTFALDADGRVLAYRVNITASLGSYVNQYGAMIPWFAVAMATGLYDIRTFHGVANCVYTHNVPTDAYRGAGRPEAAFLVERLMDEAARVIGIPPSEVRRRNFIKPEQMPYTTVTDHTYDTGEFSAHMDKALADAEAGSFDARVKQSASKGKIRGLGFATYIEICAFGTSEPAKVVLESDGTVTVHIGTQSTGQGHQTAYAQFAVGPLSLDYRGCASCRATRMRCRRAAAPVGRDPSRSARLRSILVRGSSPSRSSNSPRRSSRPVSGTSSSPMERRGWSVPIAASPMPTLPSARRTRRGSSPSASSRRRSTPTRMARMSVRSRSTPRPAVPRSSATQSLTISGLR
jgi:carbon-monoxide dehydrogenase large subunit